MQNPNQFSQTVTKGMLDQSANNNIFPAIVDAAQATALVPGQAVTLATTAGGVMKVVAAATDTTEIFGFVAYGQKQASFKAGQGVQIASANSVIYCEAGAAITRGAKVMIVVTGSKVATATMGKIIAGRAMDTALADKDLIRVLVIDGIHGLVA